MQCVRVFQDVFTTEIICLSRVLCYNITPLHCKSIRAATLHREKEKSDFQRTSSENFKKQTEENLRRPSRRRSVATAVAGGLRRSSVALTRPFAVPRAKSERKVGAVMTTDPFCCHRLLQQMTTRLPFVDVDSPPLLCTVMAHFVVVPGFPSSMSRTGTRKKFPSRRLRSRRFQHSNVQLLRGIVAPAWQANKRE